MVKRTYAKYNFVKTRSGVLSNYIDKENAISLYIFKSGWKDTYECVIEWGEYERSDVERYTGSQIESTYGIKDFSRKEKLNRINDSIL